MEEHQQERFRTSTKTPCLAKNKGDTVLHQALDADIVDRHVETQIDIVVRRLEQSRAPNGRRRQTLTRTSCPVPRAVRAPAQADVAVRAPARAESSTKWLRTPSDVHHSWMELHCRDLSMCVCVMCVYVVTLCCVCVYVTQIRVIYVML